MNHFPPSFKLVVKTREGYRVVKQYGPPAMDGEPLPKSDWVRADVKEDLGQHPSELEAAALLHTIREAQSTLTATS